MNSIFTNFSEVFSSAARDWGSIHPIVIHFPLVLLLIAPFFIVAALIFKKSKKPLFISALILMLLGTASIFLATSTGDHAAEPLEATSRAMVEALDNHVTLAEKARLYFCILTSVFLIYVLFKDKFPKTAQIIFLCLYLAAYFFNLIFLFNAAHYGGELVHKHGIQSTLYQNQP